GGWGPPARAPSRAAGRTAAAWAPGAAPGEPTPARPREARPSRGTTFLRQAVGGDSVASHDRESGLWPAGRGRTLESRWQLEEPRSGLVGDRTIHSKIRAVYSRPPRAPKGVGPRVAHSCQRKPVQCRRAVDSSSRRP